MRPVRHRPVASAPDHSAGPPDVIGPRVTPVSGGLVGDVMPRARGVSGDEPGCLRGAVVGVTVVRFSDNPPARDGGVRNWS